MLCNGDMHSATVLQTMAPDAEEDKGPHKGSGALEKTWEEVPKGSCVERWFKALDVLGASIRRVVDRGEADRYVIMCPNRVEFHSFRVSDEVAINCTDLEARLRNMTSVKDKI